MLGSYFDLDREIARIASKRETAPEAAQDKRIQAYCDFDRRIQDFVRSVGDEDRGDEDRDDEDRGAHEPGVTPAAVRRAAGPLQQIR